MRRKTRVRMHLVDTEGRGSGPPSIEGLLLRRWPEYEIGVPQLLVAAGGNPAELADARTVRVPRERVMFYERLR